MFFLKTGTLTVPEQAGDYRFSTVLAELLVADSLRERDLQPLVVGAEATTLLQRAAASYPRCPC